MSTQLTESENQSFNSTTDMVLNYQAMEQMTNLAHLMASGNSTVPKHLQNNPADCMAIVMQAAQWKMNPFAVAQKTHVVSGTLGYEAQLVNAVISSSRAIVGRFHYEYGGDWSVTGAGVGVVDRQQKGQNVNMGTQMNGSAWVSVGAVLAGETEITWGEPLYPASVTVKNSPLWKTAPKQQAAYLATKYWARLYAPAVILGVYSTDEIEQRPRTEKTINEQSESKVDSLLSKAMNKAKPDPVQEETIIDPEQETVNTEQQGPSKFENLEMSFRDCTCVEELNEVADEVGKAVNANQINKNERDELGKVYNRLKREFSQANQETGEIA